MGVLTNEWAHSRPSTAPIPQTGVRKVPLSNFCQPVGGCRKYIGWLWSDAMNNRTAFAKTPKMSENRSRTIWLCERRSPLRWWSCTYICSCYCSHLAQLRAALSRVQHSSSTERPEGYNLFGSWESSVQAASIVGIKLHSTIQFCWLQLGIYFLKRCSWIGPDDALDPSFLSLIGQHLLYTANFILSGAFRNFERGQRSPGPKSLVGCSSFPSKCTTFSLILAVFLTQI